MISNEAVGVINNCRSAGGRVVVVGTTTTRALESSVSESGNVLPAHGMAGITITPGYRFRVVDALLTNFHLPRSSLLLLVSAFAGRTLVLDAYRHAVHERYRFYSYGDCMLIL
jgi:S-adenosylmethionine:tRNA ribosyltransferase-isomerase